jgi:polar amino acid transport system substrate-binding protein
MMWTMRLTILIAIYLIGLVAGHSPSSAAGPAEGGTAVIVGLTSAPPFAMQDTDGTWQGIAVDLWRHIADELGLRFEFREMKISQLVAGLQSGELFAVATATASANREPLMEFSHPYYSSELGIAVRSSPGDGRWLDPLASLISVRMLKIAGVLIGLMSMAGFLVWLSERRANPEQFSASPLRGIGDGLWWSAVTMATVGYGDKAPRTRVGRLLAAVWMFTAIVLIALLTAQVTSSLTVTRLSGLVRGPADLAHVRVGAIEGSPHQALLREKFGVVALGYPGFGDGLPALEHGDIDAFVSVEPILRYQIAKMFAERLHVIGLPFSRADYVFAFPNGSPIRKQVNRAILSHLETDAWRETLHRYLGAEP